MIIYTKSNRKKSRKTREKEHLLATEQREIKKSIVPPLHVKYNAMVNFRETPFITSLSSDGGDTYKKSSPKYTGNKMRGIGTLHKSNAVPIFSNEEAKEQANMRR